MEDYVRGKSLENLKLLLALVIIAALAYMVYWAFTSDSIIPVDRVVGLEEIPPQKNKLSEDFNIQYINFSIENVSGKFTEEIKVSNLALFEKAIFSNDGEYWNETLLIGDRIDGWMTGTVKLDSNLNPKYVGLYFCEKDMRVGALATGKWNCFWSFKEKSI